MKLFSLLSLWVYFSNSSWHYNFIFPWLMLAPWTIFLALELPVTSMTRFSLNRNMPQRSLSTPKCQTANLLVHMLIHPPKLMVVVSLSLIQLCIAAWLVNFSTWHLPDPIFHMLSKSMSLHAWYPRAPPCGSQTHPSIHPGYSWSRSSTLCLPISWFDHLFKCWLGMLSLH